MEEEMENDILFLSDENIVKMEKYCTRELIDSVINHFERSGGIVIRNPLSDRPQMSWIITNYLSDESNRNRDVYSVVLSLAAIAGIITIGDYQNFGNVAVSNYLRSINYISEEDWQFFLNEFANHSDGMNTPRLFVQNNKTN